MTQPNIKKNIIVDSAHSQPVIIADEIGWLRIVMGIDISPIEFYFMRSFSTGADFSHI